MDPIHQFEIKKFFVLGHVGGAELAFANSAHDQDGRRIHDLDVYSRDLYRFCAALAGGPWLRAGVGPFVR